MSKRSVIPSMGHTGVALSGVQGTPPHPIPRCRCWCREGLEVPAADRGPVPLRWTLGESFHGRGDNKRSSQRAGTAAGALRDIQSYISSEMQRTSTWNSILVLQSAVALLVKQVSCSWSCVLISGSLAAAVKNTRSIYEKDRIEINGEPAKENIGMTLP